MAAAEVSTLRGSVGYELVPLAPTFGAEIRGLQVGATPMTPHTAVALVDDLARWRVLVLRDQHFGHVEHVAFSRIFGGLEVHVLDQYRVPGFPEILTIANIFEDDRPIGLYDGDDEEEWHTDHSWKSTMSSASLLYSAIAPAEGGETRFADTTAGYDELPEPLRAEVEGREAVHSMVHLFDQQRATRPDKAPLTAEQRGMLVDVVHPLVRRHPVTGRCSLLLGSMIIRGIVGLDPDRSAELLDALHRHATSARFVYCHKWQVGDLVIWDNRATMHTASPCDHRVHKRLLYRTTVH